MTRDAPNIIVTGTPGVGKTSHCEQLAEKTGLKHISINNIVKERGCHDGWDQEHQSFIVDEDKVNSPERLNFHMSYSHPTSFWTPWRMTFLEGVLSSTGTLATYFPRDGLILSWF